MPVTNAVRKMDEFEIEKNKNIIVQSEDENEDDNEEEKERKFGDYYEKYPDQLPIEYPKGKLYNSKGSVRTSFNSSKSSIQSPPGKRGINLRTGSIIPEEGEESLRKPYGGGEPPTG